VSYVKRKKKKVTRDELREEGWRALLRISGRGGVRPKQVSRKGDNSARTGHQKGKSASLEKLEERREFKKRKRHKAMQKPEEIR